MSDQNDNFKGQPFTKLDNIFYDRIMPLFRYPDHGVLLKVYRNTVGWGNKKCDDISISQFREQLHISNDSTIIKAIKRLETLELIIVKRDHKRISNYSLNWNKLYGFLLKYDPTLKVSSLWLRQFNVSNQDPFSYQKYLESPEWKALRNQKLKEVGYKCQVCNSNKQLNVHHRTYERLGNEKMDDLLALCQPCHELFSKNGKLAKMEDNINE